MYFHCYCTRTDHFLLFSLAHKWVNMYVCALCRCVVYNSRYVCTIWFRTENIVLNVNPLALKENRLANSSFVYVNSLSQRAGQRQKMREGRERQEKWKNRHDIKRKRKGQMIEGQKSLCKHKRRAYLFSIFDQIAAVQPKQMYRRLFTDVFLFDKVILAFSGKHKRGKKRQSLITLDAQIAQWCIRLTCFFHTLCVHTHSCEIVSQHFCPFLFTTEIERSSFAIHAHTLTEQTLFVCFAFPTSSSFLHTLTLFLILPIWSHNTLEFCITF